MRASLLLRSVVASALVLQLALSTTSTAQMQAALPQPQQPAAALHGDSIILQTLNRFTYGPRPGDLERVRAMGCTVGQGFFFSQPVRHSVIEHLLATPVPVFHTGLFATPLDRHALVAPAPRRG